MTRARRAATAMRWMQGPRCGGETGFGSWPTKRGKAFHPKRGGGAAAGETDPVQYLTQAIATANPSLETIPILEGDRFLIVYDRTKGSACAAAELNRTA